MDLLGIVLKEKNGLSEPQISSKKLKNHPIFEGMLVCHSLTIVDDELAGDPLDVKVNKS